VQSVTFNFSDLQSEVVHRLQLAGLVQVFSLRAIVSGCKVPPFIPYLQTFHNDVDADLPARERAGTFTGESSVGMFRPPSP